MFLNIMIDNVIQTFSSDTKLERIKYNKKQDEN